MTSNDKIIFENETVRIDTKAEKLYYEGTLNKNVIPWIFSFRYFLDGTEYKAEEIAGKEGTLKITISIRENPDCNSTFFENYALQASITLDTELCKNIVADGATAANVGKNRQLTYTILPGTEKDITITADVTDFEMEAITIGGLPLNMEVDTDNINSDELNEELNKLKEAVAELHSGVISMKNGTSELLEGVTQLKNGAISLYDGTVEIRDGVAELLDGVITMYDGTVELYDGTVILKDGTFEFKTETENLDTELKDKIGDAIKDILGNDFEVISFVSEKNKNVESVQFVIKTEAVTIPEAPVVAAPAEEKLNFWQKLLRLFGLY